MKTGQPIPSAGSSLNRSLRVLTESTFPGQCAIFISGTPEGLRFLAGLLRAQADTATQANAVGQSYIKLERQAGQLPFLTEDSVEVFEVHCHLDAPLPYAATVG